MLAAPVFADADDPRGRAARLSYARSNVLLQPSGESQWCQALTNYVVTTGDRIYAGADSRAELEIGSSVVRISQATDLTVVNLSDRSLQVGLGQGSMRVTVFVLSPDNQVEIDTPNGSLTVLSPGSYRVDVDPAAGSTLVSVNSGSLQVNATGAAQTVSSGVAVQLVGTAPVQVLSVPLPGKDDFDEWCARRDQRIRVFASARYVNAYIPGVEDLDSYGRWEVAVDYGPVWYPADMPVVGCLTAMVIGCGWILGGGLGSRMRRGVSARFIMAAGR